jgi:hypothetical protein
MWLDDILGVAFQQLDGDTAIDLQGELEAAQRAYLVEPNATTVQGYLDANAKVRKRLVAEAVALGLLPAEFLPPATPAEGA